MKTDFSACGLDLNDNQLHNLENFCDFLLKYNENVNLTAIREKEEAESKHLLDSVMGQKFFPENANVIEIGSGGGFPSVPLMAVRPDLKFTQVESVEKKCAFLREVNRRFKFPANVLCMRAEDAGKNPLYREKYDVVTARAVASLRTLLEYCLPLIKAGGIFVAYKGTKEKTEEEISESANALKILGGAVKETFCYSLPGGETHTVVIIKKEKPTPPKYPRGQGKERSKPL